MRLWRIAASTRAYGADDLSGTGASIRPGRWNDSGDKVVYCAPTAALAVLETAAHIDDGGFPLNRFLIAVEVSTKVWRRRITLDVKKLDPSWGAIPAGLVSVRAGAHWLRGGKSALLIVPSVIVPEEPAVLLNPAHADAAGITAQVMRKFEYDLLFRR